MGDSLADSLIGKAHLSRPPVVGDPCLKGGPRAKRVPVAFVLSADLTRSVKEELVMISHRRAGVEEQLDAGLVGEVVDVHEAFSEPRLSPNLRNRLLQETHVLPDTLHAHVQGAVIEGEAHDGLLPRHRTEREEVVRGITLPPAGVIENAINGGRRVGPRRTHDLGALLSGSGEADADDAEQYRENSS